MRTRYTSLVVCASKRLQSLCYTAYTHCVHVQRCSPSMASFQTPSISRGACNLSDFGRTRTNTPGSGTRAVSNLFRETEGWEKKTPYTIILYYILSLCLCLLQVIFDVSANTACARDKHAPDAKQTVARAAKQHTHT